jgi:hypothetical protein
VLEKTRKKVMQQIGLDDKQGITMRF